MKSSKEDFQKRMLSGRLNSPKNPKLGHMANIANRSPTTRFDKKSPITTNTLTNKKTVSETKEIKTALRSPRHSNQVVVEEQKIAKQYYEEEPVESAEALQQQYYVQNNVQQLRSMPPERVQMSSRVISQNIPLQISKKDGVLTVNLPNGDVYTGDIQNGKYQGQGEYYFKPYNVVYRGNFLNGKQHGPGVLINLLTNEAVYEGNWEHGMKSGSGNYSYGPNQYFNGDWKNDEKVAGFMAFPGGSYSGQWSRNKAGGFGNLKLADGTQFKGKFQNNQFLEGTVKYSNGDEYYGAMKNNRRHSDDSSYICMKTKIRYKGGFFNDQKHGKGTLFYQNGDQLTGMFRDGLLMENEGVAYKWRDGTHFQGWFRDGRPHKGTVTQPNGRRAQI